MEKRAEIIIYGRVQKAGFTDFIDEIAFDLNLNGYVKNLEDGTVQVVCEGREDFISELLDRVNIAQYPIRVENIDVTYKKLTDEYKTVEVIRDEDLTAATYERMDTAVKYMREMNSNLGNKIDRVSDKIDQNGVEIREMNTNLGNKIDQNGVEIREMSSNLGQKMDVISSKIDQSRTEITSEIRLNRDDFRSHLDERIANIEHELTLIKEKIMPSKDF
jgi:acylphosphatase